MGENTTCLTCGTELPPGTTRKRCSKCALSDLLAEDEESLPSVDLVSTNAVEAGNHSSNYATGREIARGGMGAVLDAQDRKFDRTVAMKVMLQPNASESERRRFLLEAKVLGHLAHPNIVPVHDLGTDADGRMFYTMKLVQGETLHDLIQKIRNGDEATVARYPLSNLLTIFRKVCDAMAFAHSRGIIHRDLKPQNIMVGEFGEVLVMDWGLAKILPGSKAAPAPGRTIAATESVETLPPHSATDDETETLVSAPSDPDATVATDESAKDNSPRLSFGTGDTQPLSPEELEQTMEGTVMGTPHYMAPEQAQGRITDMDARSDIFSLGGILYGLLTLRPPVEGKSVAEILSKVSNGEITPPTSIGESPSDSNRPAPTIPHLPGNRIPTALSAVAMKALQVDADDRYQSVESLAADIEAYQNGFATSAENAGFLTQIRLLIRRNRREFTIGFAAWLIITILAIWFVINQRASERRAVKGESDARHAENIATNATARARLALADTSIALANAALREGNASAMRDALDKIPHDLQGQEWHYLTDRTDTSMVRFPSGKQADETVTADPSRPGIFAVAAPDGPVRIYDAHNESELLQFTPNFLPGKSFNHLQLAWSPDGSHIAIGRSESGGIAIHHARNGSHIKVLDAGETEHLEFSPDGRFLLQDTHKSLILWDAASSKRLWSYQPQNDREVRGGFLPGAEGVLAYNLRQGMLILDLNTGKIKRHAVVTESDKCRIAIRPDGAQCVRGDIGAGVRTFDLRTGETMFHLHLPSVQPHSLAYTPDSEKLITVSRLHDGRQSIQIWNAETGEELGTLLGGEGKPGPAVFHPASGELLIASKPTRVWRLEDAPLRRTLGQSWDSTLAFCGSDQVLVSAVNGRLSGLTRFVENRVETLWRPSRGDYSIVSSSRDGRIISFLAPGKPAPIVLLRNPTALGGPTIRSHPVERARLARLNPAGTRIAILTKDELRTSDVETDASPVRHESVGFRQLNKLLWTPDGESLIAMGTARADRGKPDSQELLVRWHAKDGTVVATSTCPSTMNAMAVAPDGQHFVEAGGDKAVRIRAIRTLAVTQTFRAHDASVTALAWHPSLPVIATASDDLTIKLWNSDTLELLGEIRALKRAPHTLEFSPSGQHLGSASQEGVTRIWNVTTLLPAKPSP